MNRKLKTLRNLFVPYPGISVITAFFAAVTLFKASIDYWYEGPEPISTGIYFLTLLVFIVLLILPCSALFSLFRILAKRRQLKEAENMRWDLLGQMNRGGLGTADETSEQIVSLDLTIARLQNEIAAIQ